MIGYLEKQVIYDVTGVWPGRDEPHGPEAFAIFYLEKEFRRDLTDSDEDTRLLDCVIKGYKPGRNEPCPCGSGKKAKRCHWKSITQARHRTGTWTSRLKP